MGFQDRDYVKEKHKELEKAEKRKISWTYVGGAILLLAALIREIFFR